MANEYEALMQKENIPTTDEEIKKRFDQVASEQGTDLNNDDQYSPFWALLSALCVYPAKILIKFVHATVLPNLYIKTAVDEWLDTLGWAYETPRKKENKAKGAISFRRLSGSGTQTISAGTIIQSYPVNGTVYKLVTLFDTVFNNGDIEITVQCEAVKPGAGYNLAAGFYTILPESIPGIKSVINAEGWLIINGADRESDDDYRYRLRDLFSLLNHYHVDEVYRSIITSFSGISTKNVFFDKNVPRGPGSADALILLDHGSVSTQLLADINKHIRDDGNHGIGDDMLVRAIDTAPVDLTIQIYVDPTLSQSEKDALKVLFENYVKAAFRQIDSAVYSNQPIKVEPFKRFSFSRLSAQAHKEFIGLFSVDFNRDDIIHGLNISSLNVLSVSMFDAN